MLILWHIHIYLTIKYIYISPTIFNTLCHKTILYVLENKINNIKINNKILIKRKFNSIQFIIGIQCDNHLLFLKNTDLTFCGKPI